MLHTVLLPFPHWCRSVFGLGRHNFWHLFLFIYLDHQNWLCLQLHLKKKLCWYNPSEWILNHTEIWVKKMLLRHWRVFHCVPKGRILAMLTVGLTMLIRGDLGTLPQWLSQRCVRCMQHSVCQWGKHCRFVYTVYALSIIWSGEFFPFFFFWWKTNFNVTGVVKDDEELWSVIIFSQSRLKLHTLIRPSIIWQLSPGDSVDVYDGAVFHWSCEGNLNDLAVRKINRRI